MYHRIKAKKLNRTSSHRKALLKNMANSLVMHEQITTTLPKAKALRPYVEKLVTIGKKTDLSARRMLYAKQNNANVVNKLFDVLSSRYESRHGGYLRIMKAGFRYGDNAPLAVIEFVDRDPDAKSLNSNLSLNEEEVKNFDDNKVEKRSKTSKSSISSDVKIKKESVKNDTKKHSSDSTKGKSSSIPRKSQGK